MGDYELHDIIEIFKYELFGFMNLKYFTD